MTLGKKDLAFIMVNAIFAPYPQATDKECRVVVFIWRVYFSIVFNEQLQDLNTKDVRENRLTKPSKIREKRNSNLFMSVESGFHHRRGTCSIHL
jgi:hypothetical protein